MLARSLLVLHGVAAVAAIKIPNKEIAPGVNMPVVSIGTWTEGTKAGDKNVSAIINNWLDLGAVGIDTALVYFDQKDIADALAQRGTDRTKLFITSKIPTCLGASATRKFVNYNLEALKTSYLDLLLIHAPGLPGPLGGCSSTWAVLEEYQAKGALKSIGVSNWGPKNFEELKFKVRPAVNQIEFNVFSHDDATEKYCQQHNITIMAYSPLGDPARSKGKSVFADAGIRAIATKHSVSAAQVALRWIAQKRHIMTVLSASKDHQANDADLFSFALEDDEMTQLDKLKDQAQSVMV